MLIIQTVITSVCSSSLLIGAFQELHLNVYVVELHNLGGQSYLQPSDEAEIRVCSSLASQLGAYWPQVSEDNQTSQRSWLA